MPNDIDKQMVIKYYDDSTVIYNENLYKEKFTFSKPIPENKIIEAIKSLEFKETTRGIYKVYYENKEMYSQNIPIKIELYQLLFVHPSIIWTYDKFGRLLNVKTFFDNKTDDFTTYYQYHDYEKIVTKTRNKRTQYYPYIEKKEHFFYDDKECLIKRLLYFDGKLDSIKHTDKRDLISCIKYKR